MTTRVITFTVNFAVKIRIIFGKLLVTSVFWSQFGMKIKVNVTFVAFIVIFRPFYHIKLQILISKLNFY